ncbi:MAG TPA: hypothetical protein VGO48_10410 [Conexibacter sp.]|jgi:hypothetical protein|nr:hypothetical protein [Conexibacter sp.]
MRRYTKALLTGALAALILTTAVGVASARNLSVSNQRIRIVWRELILSGGLENTCEVTLEGSFHYRTIIKEPRLIGYITRADLNRCTVPTRVLGLPWHITYRSFRGVLPNITAVRLDLIGAGFLVEFRGLANCLFLSEAARPALGEATIGAGGVVTGLRVDEAAPIRLFRDLGGGIVRCPSEGFLRGTGTVTLLGNNTSITITLI